MNDDDLSPYERVQRKKAGRPVVGEKVETRLPDDVREAVEARAEEEGISRAEMLRRLITDGLRPGPDRITVFYADGAVGHLLSTDEEETHRQERRAFDDPAVAVVRVEVDRPASPGPDPTED